MTDTRRAEELAEMLADAGLKTAGTEDTGGWTLVTTVDCRKGTVTAVWDGAWYLGFYPDRTWHDGDPERDNQPAWWADVNTDDEAVVAIVRAVDEHGGGEAL